MALVAMAALGGCDDTNACTLADNEAGLRIQFVGPDDMPVPDVTLEIVLTVDGDVYSLACGRPDGSGPLLCEDAEGSGDHRIETQPDTPAAIRIWRQDGGDARGPEMVRVQATSGDAPLVDVTFEPTYETDEPNGKGCGLVDHVVEETIVIDVGM